MSDMFNSVLESLQQFIDDMDADWCMVYDYMEAHCGVLTEEQWDQVEVIYHQNLTDLRYWNYHEQIRTYRCNLSRSGKFDWH